MALEWKNEISFKPSELLSEEKMLSYNNEVYYSALLEMGHTPVICKLNSKGEAIKVVSKESVTNGHYIGTFVNALGVHMLFYKHSSKAPSFVLFTLGHHATTLSSKVVALPFEPEEKEYFSKRSLWKGWQYVGQVEDRLLLSKVEFSEERQTISLETIEIDDSNKVTTHLVHQSHKLHEAWLAYELPSFYLSASNNKIYALGYYRLKGEKMNQKTGTYHLSIDYNNGMHNEEVRYNFTNVRKACVTQGVEEVSLNPTCIQHFDAINDVFRVYSIINHTMKSTTYSAICVDKRGDITEVSRSTVESSPLKLPNEFAGSYEILVPMAAKLQPNPLTYITTLSLENDKATVLGYLTHKNKHFYVFTLEYETGNITAYKIKQ